MAQQTWAGAVREVWQAAGRHKIASGLVALCAAASLAAIALVASGSAGPAGLTAEDHDASYADAVERLLRRDVAERRRLARERAERFDWPTAVDGFLAAHGLSLLPRGGEEAVHAV